MNLDDEIKKWSITTEEMRMQKNVKASKKKGITGDQIVVVLGMILGLIFSFWLLG